MLSFISKYNIYEYEHNKLRIYNKNDKHEMSTNYNITNNEEYEIVANILINEWISVEESITIKHLEFLNQVNLQRCKNYVRKDYKVCSNCKENLPLTDEYFNKSKITKDGFRYECKKCKKELDKQYRNSHKKEKREYRKQYREKNKTKLNVEYQHTRTMKCQLPHTLTVEQWNQIKKHFKDRCAYCGKEKKLTIDHFIPLSKGGELSKDNVIPACTSCNCSKHGKDFKEWYHQYKYYSKEREENILNFLKINK